MYNIMRIFIWARGFPQHFCAALWRRWFWAEDRPGFGPAVRWFHGHTSGRRSPDSIVEWNWFPIAWRNGTKNGAGDLLESSDWSVTSEHVKIIVWFEGCYRRSPSAEPGKWQVFHTIYGANRVQWSTPLRCSWSQGIHSVKLLRTIRVLPAVSDGAASGTGWHIPVFEFLEMDSILANVWSQHGNPGYQSD